jgi:hypothetical protein
MNEKVSPAWLRPGVLVLVISTHLAIFVGIPWPTRPDKGDSLPLEVQVIPRGDAIEALAAEKDRQIVEIKTETISIDVQAVESTSVHAREVAELKPAELTIESSRPLPEISPTLQPSEQGAMEPNPLEASRPTLPPTAPAAELPPAQASFAGDDPVRQETPRPSEHPAAELDSLEALHETTALPAVAAVRELPPGRVLVTADTPVRQEAPGPPEQMAAKLHSFEALHDTAALPAVAPVRERPPSRASITADTPVRQEAPRPPEQMAAERHSFEALHDTAALPAVAPVRERPPSQASTEARDPPRPDSLALSEQPATRLLALESPPITAAAAVMPSAREFPTPQNWVTASNSLQPAQLSATELNPVSSMARPAPVGGGPINTSRVDEIIRYVEEYDGGNCFYVVPVAINESEAALEGYGVSTRPFSFLDTAFRREIGFEAAIGVRVVTPAQCPAITFLARLRGTGAPHLHIDGSALRPGDTLTGTVVGYGNRNVELLLVSDTGIAENMSHLLKPHPEGKSFDIAMLRRAGASGGQPQLLIAIASPRPLEALRLDAPLAAERIFPALLNEATRTGQALAAMARYFKLEK